MIYPHPVRENDNILGLSTYHAYGITYAVKTITGEVFTGVGKTVAESDDKAQKYALSLLKSLCPECKGYIEHKATVTQI